MTKKNAKGKAKSTGPVKKALDKCFCVLCQTCGGNPRSHDMKYCKRHKVITEMRKQSDDEHMSVEQLFASSKKLSKNLRKNSRELMSLSPVAIWIVIDSSLDMGAK
eukprot:6012049-Ditylum_brightwellii.AAC.1